MSTQKSRFSEKARNTFWPAIDSLETARTTSRQGFWAAIFVAVVTTLLVLVVIALGPVEGMPVIDAWAFIDVGLFVAIAIGIHRMSRIAAISGLLLYLIERLYIVFYAGISGNVVVTIFIILAFINGVRGTFGYHRLRHQSINAALESSEDAANQ